MTKTWLITGCSSGFGRVLAEAVLARGDRAMLAARDVSRLVLQPRFGRSAREEDRAWRT
jgi:NAD(P)-dependent dehydrogenase (short-subunit alcohol dehydrogenase family)